MQKSCYKIRQILSISLYLSFRACLEFFKLIINSLWFWRNIGEGIYRDK